MPMAEEIGYQTLHWYFGHFAGVSASSRGKVMLKLAAAFYALFVCGAAACNAFVGEATEFVPAAKLTFHQDEAAQKGDFTLVDQGGLATDYVFRSTSTTDLPYSLAVSTKDESNSVLIRELDGGRWLVDMVIFTCVATD